MAGAVADGEAVDWEAVEALRPGHTGQVRALRALASLAPDQASLASTTGTERAPRWTIALLLIVAFQVAVAVPGLAVVRGGIVPALHLLAGFVFLAAALALVRGNPADRRAISLGSFFACVASASVHRESSAVPSALALFAQTLRPECLLPGFLWRFAEDFPQVRRLGWWDRLAGRAARASFVLGGMLALAAAADHVVPGGLGGPLAREGDLYWTLIMALSLPALSAPFVRAASAPPNERRRVALFGAGLVAGPGPLFATVILDSWIGVVHRALDVAEIGQAATVILFALLLTTPLTTGYAVVAHRVFDLRFLFHRALRRLLAQASLTGLALGPVAILLSLLWTHRDRPLGETMDSPASLGLLTLTGLALLTLAARTEVLQRVDSTLNPEEARLPEALVRFGLESRVGVDAEGVARALAQCVVRNLGASRVSVLVRTPSGTHQVLEGPARPLESDSGIPVLAQEDPSPLSCDPADSASAFPWLPEADRQWVVDGGVQIVVPISAEPGVSRGLLTLGDRVDDRPYSPAERTFLAALGASAALGLENCELRGLGPHRAAIEVPGWECGSCGLVVEQDCACGGRTTRASVPLLLGGKFRVDRVLGRGGMGVVYLACDIDLARLVALKTLPRASAEAVARLRREARSMAAVVHPAVAQIHGTESWRGVPVLVVEYLAGGTLARRLGQPWAVADVLALARTLTDGVAAVHGRGLLHRDIKPSNIGFAEDDHPKLLDFGLARLVDGMAWTDDDGDAVRGPVHHTRRAGTPLYAAPEVLAGEGPSAASDMWSLGVVLYECLAGQHPFRDVPARQLHAAAMEGYPPLRAVRSDLPEALQALLSALLDAAPSRRPASAVVRRGLAKPD